MAIENGGASWRRTGTALNLTEFVKVYFPRIMRSRMGVTRRPRGNLNLLLNANSSIKIYKF
jgi:hypothetical protein